MCNFVLNNKIINYILIEVETCFLRKIFTMNLFFLNLIPEYVSEIRKLLNKFFSFSEEDYDAFCLAYMFTYRDFEMGTLGLAWTGDLKNAGGVCEKNGVS